MTERAITEIYLARRSRFLPVRIVRARPRLFMSILTAILVGLLLPDNERQVSRLLLAWNAGTWLYLALAVVMVARGRPDTIRLRAKFQDEGQYAILALAIVASIASVGAIVAQLGFVKDMAGFARLAHIGLAVSTIVSAWLFIHLTFALHYAHEYFQERRERPDAPPGQRGGLSFPGSDAPDYTDFLYFAFVIGVASQTADISICSRPMRRIALLHCVLSFFFNTTILALTINIAAGLI